ncbi:putative membrane-bound dehydrogenase domain-containing protein [Cyclobacterium lianum]|uniref:Putative membrane-bound dehydrogenase domain-containing protein n=2 Tax=Cyclobacterium lianum TaxID=388280 RepID=A0A1M7IM39_9BACT|nr:putative membrane-bound dehydrogenase domain-containing protein [Cyclobacterium lianum]
MKIAATPVLLFLFCMQSCGPGAGEDAALLFVPDGLEVTLWASSPLFQNPTNMDVDARGRLWVTEAVNYRDFRNADGHLVRESGDRVVILEDSNGDGQADSSRVFVQDEDLRSPLGIAVVGNQVIVSCSPNVIVYTDADGDDVPDSKEIFLTGFGGKDHDHGLHAGQLGPDGKWYFITGNAGPHHVRDKDGWTLRSGSVYNEYTPYSTENLPAQVSDDGNVYTGGLIIRLNPDGTGMEVMSHNFRNAYEVFVDSFGNMWQSDNDDQTASCRTTWLMEGSNAGFFSEQGDRTWQADRRPGQTIAEAHWHQHDPGVLPAGDIYGAGSPTGMLRIEGDELGEAHRGLLLAADAGRNIIFGYHPRPDGSGYSLADRQNFIASVDVDNAGYIWHQVEADTSKWFRPSDVTLGTDGSLFVADWYDPIVGGHQMRDKVGQGKIYRITKKGRDYTNPKIDYATVSGQVEALRNPAVHVRAQAAKLLREQGASAIPALESLLEDPNPFYQARAIWVLAGMGRAGIQKIQPFLSHQNAELALTTVRALAAFAPQSLPSLAESLLPDASPMVLRELAILLRHLDDKETKSIYARLIEAYDGEDPWYRNALGIGLRGREKEVFAREWADVDPLEWSSAQASLVWEMHPEAAIPALAVRVGSKTLGIEERMQALETLAFIPDRKSVAVFLDLADGEGALTERAAWWLQFRKYNEWQAFLEDWEPPLDKLPAGQPGLLASLAIFNDSLASDNQRQQAKSDLAENSDGRLHLALLAAKGNIPDSLKAQLVLEWSDERRPAVRSLLARFFGNTGEMQEGVVNGLEGDAAAGKVLAAQNCLACHRIGESGNEIGPHLVGIRQKMDGPTLVNAIVQPDAAIGFGYESWLVRLKNGAMLYGLLQSNGPVVTVLTSQGQRFVVPASEVAEKRQVPVSLMPRPAEMDLSPQDIADIRSYLMQGDS